MTESNKKLMNSLKEQYGTYENLLQEDWRLAEQYRVGEISWDDFIGMENDVLQAIAFWQWYMITEDRERRREEMRAVT